jgi:hypothetical protein
MLCYKFQPKREDRSDQEASAAEGRRTQVRSRGKCFYGKELQWVEAKKQGCQSVAFLTSECSHNLRIIV